MFWADLWLRLWQVRRVTSGGQVQEGSGRVQKEGSGGGKQGQFLLW